MYVGMIEPWALRMLLKSFHENFSDLFIKITLYARLFPSRDTNFSLQTNFSKRN